MAGIISDIGRLSFNDMEAMPDISKHKSTIAFQKIEARAAFENYDFSPFGSVEDQGSWSWREKMGSFERGSVTAFIREPGKNETTAFVFECVWTDGVMSTSVTRR
jgi:hypothetical protein